MEECTWNGSSMRFGFDGGAAAVLISVVVPQSAVAVVVVFLLWFRFGAKEKLCLRSFL